MQRILLASRPEGEPTAANFRLDSATTPVAHAGEVLCEVIWLSLDPYMRGRMDAAASYADPVPIGGVMEGGTVCRVIASQAPGFDPGDIVESRLGWQTHGLATADQLRKLDPTIAPVQTALGILGMPGFTAWIGLTEHAQPKAGECLVVSAATGAVGSVVGQLAKKLGMRVVGVAGGTEKCQYAVDVLGFDACVDHRAHNDARALGEAIAEACPNGVDIYFENVGGKTLQAVVPKMNVGGRIPVCGMISWYNGQAQSDISMSLDTATALPRIWRNILVKRLSVRGYIITDHYARFGEFLREVAPLVKNGELHYRESITEGLEAAPAAFLGLLRGENFGKQLVRVAN